MADRIAGKSTEAQWRVVRETAGTATVQKVREARSRLEKQPRIHADAEFLIKTYQWLALELAGTLLRERESTRASSKRQQDEARSRSFNRFLLGAVLGFVAAFILTKRFWS